jgi:transposase
MISVTLIKKELGTDQVISDLTGKIEFLLNRQVQMEQKSRELTMRVQRLESYEEDNKNLRQENTELKDENADLKAKIAELKASQNNNSNNSSKPPSSDGYRKKPALVKEKRGKQGGQEGHKGRTLEQVENPDKTIYCDPDHCGCGHSFTEDEFILSERRQVFNIPQPKLDITEYQIYKAKCPDCGTVHKGNAPEGVNAPTQYGNGVKAYVALLNVQFKLPFKKIQLLFGDLFGYSINESTVYSATRQCFKNLAKSEEIIKTRVAESQVVHADETGLRVAGKLHWLHTATTLLDTYLFVHEKRGGKALKSDKSILDRYTGWLVHDCWSSYFGFDKIKHALCGAHIVRELEGLIENEQREWARIMQRFLLNLNKMSHEERAKRRRPIVNKFKYFCSLGDQEEPPPKKTPGSRGRYKRTKGRNLVERLIREEKAVLAFAFNEDVPFTNNLAYPNFCCK